jgi:hemolysin III
LLLVTHIPPSEASTLPQRHRPFSIWRFSLLVLLQFALLLIGLRVLAPALWARQVAAGPGALILVFLSTQLFNCFFEWAFHRYVLHAVAVRWLRGFAHAHRNHHSLTNIQLRRDEAGPGRIVLNRYPIVDEEQFEDAAFPAYSLIAFWLLFTPLLVFAQRLLPNAPVYLGGYAAITWSMAAYEVIHCIEHFPYSWWERAIGHRIFGGLWRRIYGFHHFHHANIGSNEGISGFLGIPLADWALRTYHQPTSLLLHGRMATAKEFAVSPPWPFVTRIDRWVRAREAKIIRPTT